MRKKSYGVHLFALTACRCVDGAGRDRATTARPSNALQPTMTADRTATADRTTADRTYADLAAAWRTLRVRGARVREVACVGAPRTLLAVDLGDPALPLVSLSAGVHGDEPAAPWALLRAGRATVCSTRASATGSGRASTRAASPPGRARTPRAPTSTAASARGGTTPEARAVLTANRDRRFALALDLHEDLEAAGCYVYEPLRPGCAAFMPGRWSRALDDAGFPVQTLHAGLRLGAPAGPEAAQRPLGPARCWSTTRREQHAFRGPAQLARADVPRHAPRALTFETPRPRPWDERIAAHRVAVARARLAVARARGAAGRRGRGRRRRRGASHA